MSTSDGLTSDYVVLAQALAVKFRTPTPASDAIVGLDEMRVVIPGIWGQWAAAVHIAIACHCLVMPTLGSLRKSHCE